MKVTIIGAGIGGLTFANALQKNNIDFEIFEAFKEFKSVGAGIILAENAMHIFRELGIDQRLNSLGNSLKSVRISDGDLSTLIEKSKRSNEQLVSLHRADLQKVLLENLPNEKIHLGKKIKEVITEGQNAKLLFEDLTSCKAELVVGCDGIHSKVRDNVVAKSYIRNAKQSCWRGVLDHQLPKEFREHVHEIWHDGKRIGLVQINDRQVYWYALKKAGKNDSEITTSELAILFKDYHPIVSEVLKQTADSQIILNEMIDLKPIAKWYDGRICLLGDAAHATTPNMGQGACQSIVDAWELANCLSKIFSPEKAFLEYQKSRMSEAKGIVKMSWTLGKLAHWDSTFSVFCRNNLLKLSSKFQR